MNIQPTISAYKLYCSFYSVEKSAELLRWTIFYSHTNPSVWPKKNGVPPSIYLLSVSLPLASFSSLTMEKIAGWKIGKLLDEYTNSINKILLNKWILIGLSMLCSSIQHPVRRMYVAVVMYFTPVANAACCRPNGFFPTCAHVHSVCEYGWTYAISALLFSKKSFTK